MQEKVLIKRPKYHPQTGVELDGSYDFDFSLPEERYLVNQLARENAKLKEQVLDFKVELHEVNHQLRRTLAELAETSEQRDKYQSLYVFKKSFNKAKREVRAVKRIVKYQCTGEAYKGLLNDLKVTGVTRGNTGL